MREYNFMSSHSRYSDSQYAGSGINEGYGYSSRYEGSNRFRPMSRNYSGNYQSDYYLGSAHEPQKPYTGRFKTDIEATETRDAPTVNTEPTKQSVEKPRSESNDERRRSGYRGEYPSFYRSTRDRYEGRSRHYESHHESRHSHSSHRRSSHRKSRRSSSRRRSRSRSDRRRRHH